VLASCPIVELRQYTLIPGTRAAFVELFEREFVDTQHAAGMRLLGTFADLDAPNRFVWLRGFADMTTRREALTSFYYGPCWRAHRDEANAMIVDSDNVRLLRPVPGFPRLEDASGSAGQITITIQPLDDPTDRAATTALRERDDTGLLAVLATAAEVNDFPQLPVIEDESVLVVVAAGDRPAREGATNVLRLEPTPRSAIGR
jgi:hypothetical protein